MNNKLRAFYFTLVLCLLLPQLIGASDLLTSRRSSYYTYVFEITNAQAKYLYSKGLTEMHEGYLHTLVDSFLTDSGIPKHFAQGHYIRARAVENKLHAAIMTINNFDVHVLNNNTDLNIQVVDLEGNAVNDAIVKIKGKKLRFDVTTQAFVDKKSNQKGLLSVQVDEHIAYYDLERELNNPAFKRASRIVLYGSPVKYVWKPIKYIVMLPIDGVRSLVQGRARGSIYWTKFFFGKRVPGWFISDKEQKGYLVFNKPTYKPGDTVMWKAFMVDKKGNPYKKQVDVWITDYHTRKKLNSVSAYAPGGYQSFFVLHDSLNMRLDQQVYFQLKASGDTRTLLSYFFRFEDYDLSKMRLDVTTDGDKQFRGKPYSITIKGSDENELNLMDARVEITILAKRLSKQFETYCFLPDTLLTINQDLDPSGATEIEIPDAEFPKANFSYRMKIKMLTSDNQQKTKTETVQYFQKLEQLDFSLGMDSLVLQKIVNGEPSNDTVRVYGKSDVYYSGLLYEGTAPAKIKLDNKISTYWAFVNDKKKELHVSDESSMLSLRSTRSKDSLMISSVNPRNIPFSYQVYKLNKELEAGSGTALNFQVKTGNDKHYYVNYRYVWGGKSKTVTYKIPFDERKLKVSYEQPALTYPGETTAIKVKVSDAGGAPVEGVDISAFAYTNKFDKTPRAVPTFYDQKKSRRLINNFELEKKRAETDHSTDTIDYAAWCELAQLDTMEYYKFRYPADSLYRYEYKTSDRQTQFSPFVFDHGELKTIHVVYIDSRPVYLSWMNNERPYSFEIDSGFHDISLRTNDAVYSLNQMTFTKGVKTIFSLGPDIAQANQFVYAKENKLENYERDALVPFIFPYQNNFSGKMTYLKNTVGDITKLNGRRNYRSSVSLAGPVIGHQILSQRDEYELDFMHEPNFKYEFKPNLLKMRCMDQDKLFPSVLRNSTRYALGDTLVSDDVLDKTWEQMLYVNQKNVWLKADHFPSQHPYGNLRFIVPNGLANHGGPMHLLLFALDDPWQFSLNNPNYTQNYHLPEGLYHARVICRDGYSMVADSLWVHRNGKTVYDFNTSLDFKKDSLSIAICKYLRRHAKALTRFSTFKLQATEDLRQLCHAYYFKKENLPLSTGHVLTEVDARPLCDTWVHVKGTRFVTKTDSLGAFAIPVPQDGNTLEVFNPSYGYKSVVLKSNEELFVRVGHKEFEFIFTQNNRESSSNLVPIMKRNSAGSSVTLDMAGADRFLASTSIAEVMQGQMAGVDIQIVSGNPGAGSKIAIRGLSTVEGGEPLIVIDGVPQSITLGDLRHADIEEIAKKLGLAPQEIKSLSVLKDAASTAAYGSRGANGVIVINTTKGTPDKTEMLDKSMAEEKGADYDDDFLQSAMANGSLRSNFSDYAFWEPTLRTDENGEATFTVTFPDDVTSWDTHFLAMNDKRQSGQASGNIKSYKPLMATLSVPRFLVQGDTANAIGKTLNYMSETNAVKTTFEMNGVKHENPERFVKDVRLDTLAVMAASTDTIKLSYQMSRADGYFDGESRDIRVYPQGMETHKGQFFALSGDTSITLSAEPDFGKMHLYVRSDALEVLRYEISNLIKYKHNCNEQMASKLHALLSEKLIADYLKEKFNGEAEIKKLIRNIEKNRNGDGLWGWWKGNPDSEWISEHVLSALLKAQKMGYEVELDPERFALKYVAQLETDYRYSSLLGSLRLLKQMDAPLDYRRYIMRLDTLKNYSTQGKLQLMQLKQQVGLKVNLDSLWQYEHETLFGNTYYAGDEVVHFCIWDNAVQNTLTAYEVLKADTADHGEKLENIRHYLFERRSDGRWTNTYETARILETILPDIMPQSLNPKDNYITLSGGVDATIKKFPFDTIVTPNEPIALKKYGAAPMYVSGHQRYWDSSPKADDTYFEVESFFEDVNDSILEAGKEVTMVAKVRVKKDADYLMVNIPIPASCSYASKEQHVWNETHREYFRNETAIYCRKLNAGTYTFKVKLLPRYTGVYHLNPAKAELMYFPTFKGNNEMKRVEVNK